LLYHADRLASEAASFTPFGAYAEGKKLWSSPVANNISDNEAMDKYSGKLFVIGIIVFVILMCVIGNNDDGFN
jgi:hypothetical protein